MAARRNGGCLSILIFLLVLILAVLLLATLFSSVKSTDGGTLLTELLDQAGFDMEESPVKPEPEEKPEPSDSLSDLAPTDAIRVEITEEKLRALFEEAMMERFPLTLEQLSLRASGEMEISGKAERDRFLELVDSADTALGALERMALQLAPEQLHFSVTIGISYDAAEQTIALDPQKMQVEDISLPVGYLPDAWMSGLNRSLTDYFASYGRAPAGISVYDGYLHLYFE